MKDSIIIEDLRIHAHVGVPDEEIARVQTLLVSIRVEKSLKKAAKSDSIENTVDYAKLAKHAQDIASEKPHHLIETLAEDIAQAFLKTYPIDQTCITIKKMILNDAAWAGVSITRSRS
jgi:dihydroneopterin aldolase